MAQQTLFPRSNRQAGTYTSPNLLIEPSTQVLYVVMDVHPSEVSGTKTVQFELFRSVDVGANWISDRKFVTSGPYSRPVYAGMRNAATYAGQLFQLRITFPQAINCGATVLINEAPVVPDEG